MDPNNLKITYVVKNFMFLGYFGHFLRFGIVLWILVILGVFWSF
jgi:hypothetical protein